MTKLLAEALEAVTRLSAESQDEIARAMLRLAQGDGEPEAIDPAHLPAVLEGLAQAKAKVFSTPEEVEAAFRRFES
jgi:hypothetical protein